MSRSIADLYSKQYTPEERKAILRQRIESNRRLFDSLEQDDKKRELMAELQKKHEEERRLRELNERFDRERNEWRLKEEEKIRRTLIKREQMQQEEEEKIIRLAEERRKLLEIKEDKSYGVQLDFEYEDNLSRLRTLHKNLERIRSLPLSKSDLDIRSESIKNEIFTIAERLSDQMESNRISMLKQIVNITGQKDCPICFEEYNTTDHIRVYLDPCEHSFGYSCIEYLQNDPNPRCPICNTRIEEYTDEPSVESIRYAGSFTK